MLEGLLELVTNPNFRANEAPPVNDQIGFFGALSCVAGNTYTYRVSFLFYTFSVSMIRFT